MDRRISQKFGNLCKVHLVFPDELFGKFNLHLGKKLNDSAPALFPKKLLELGTSDEIIMADILDGKRFPNMFFQIKKDFIVGSRICF